MPKVPFPFCTSKTHILMANLSLFMLKTLLVCYYLSLYTFICHYLICMSLYVCYYFIFMSILHLYVTSSLIFVCQNLICMSLLASVPRPSSFHAINSRLIFNPPKISLHSYFSEGQSQMCFYCVEGGRTWDRG